MGTPTTTAENAAVRAGMARSKRPEPTAVEVQGFVDMAARLEIYLEAAGEQWVKDNGLPTNRAKRDVGLRLDPRWHEDAGSVAFHYYADSHDAYDYVDSYLRIPVEDLLPQFGEATAFLQALTGTGKALAPLTG